MRVRPATPEDVTTVVAQDAACAEEGRALRHRRSDGTPVLLALLLR